MKKTSRFSRKRKKTSPLRLPHEIVHDILLCLPAKSLQRLKLVSKPWGSLISDPNFAESHLRRANNTSQHNDNLLRVGQIMEPTGPAAGKCLSLYSMDSNGKNREVVTLDYAFDLYSYSHALILGSCNGLLLITVDYGATCFIWNPSTGKYKKIPPSYISGDSLSLFISALGYESTSGNYKGIIVSHYISGRSSPNTDCSVYDEMHYEVFDYKRNSWTSHDHGEFPYNICSCSAAVMVNGFPHWYVYSRKFISEDKDHFPNIYHYTVTYLIVYFDWKSEIFKEVELPEWSTEEMKFTLGALRGWLTMSVNPHGSSSTEVWAMKEYGVPESWTKLFVIPSSSKEFRPMCFAGKKEVLMELDVKKLISFNLITNKKKILSLNRGRYECYICTYVGSLVFPEEHGNEASRRKESKKKKKEKKKKNRVVPYMSDNGVRK